MALNGFVDPDYDDDNTTTTMPEAISRDVQQRGSNDSFAAVEEPWETVDAAGNVAGVLIVPPEEDATAPRTTGTAVSQPRGDNIRSSIIGSNLSFPESVPSDIGSVNSEVLGDNDNANPRDPRDDVVLRLPGRLVVRRGSIPFILAGMLVLLSLVASATVYFDRGSLRAENLQLKRELLEAKDALSRLSAAQPKQDASRTTPPPVCYCEAGSGNGGIENDGGTTTIVDNCWVRAKANVHLGECADNAKTMVQEKFQSFQQSLKKSFRDVSESWTLTRTKEDDDAAPSESASSDQDKEMGVSFQGFRAAVDVLLSGVAVLAVSTAVEELISHVFEPQVEDPED